MTKAPSLDQLKQALDAGLIDQATFDAATAGINAHLTGGGAIAQGQDALALAERAAGKGITCSYHPNSPMGSVFRTEEDYEILLNGLHSKHIGYTPDVGHIAKAGMDPLAIIKRYRELVNLVHYKDMYADGRWAQTGEGVIQFNEITEYLVDTNYEGWIVMEDEADQAITDPDGVTTKDGVYVNSKIKPIL